MDIFTVPVGDLHRKLGFKEPLKHPDSSLSKPLGEWNMDSDDSPILRYIYRNFKPRRHLEFGTWQGEGVLYCLEECKAMVWTINIPFGEVSPKGKSAYCHTANERKKIQEWAKKIGLPYKKDWYRTDSIGYIGRKYLEKDLGNRVCQIYCDSTEWDISQYPEAFFDSILIDGGHQPRVILSDTEKALKLLRKGGILMWHDFCPDKEVRKKCQSVKEVVSTIESNRDWIDHHMESLFWINPSWILLGIKK